MVGPRLNILRHMNRTRIGLPVLSHPAKGMSMTVSTSSTKDPSPRLSHRCTLLLAFSVAALVGAACGNDSDTSAPSAGTTALNGTSSSVPSQTTLDSTLKPTPSSSLPPKPPSPGGDPDVVVKVVVAPTSGSPGTAIVVTTMDAARRCSPSAPANILFVDSKSFSRGLTSSGEFIIPPRELSLMWQSNELRANYVLPTDIAKGRALIRLECRDILVGVTDFMVL